MSYSNTFSGRKAGILLAIAAFAATQETTDRSSGASDGVIFGHQQQIKATESMVKAALETPDIADDTPIYVGINGHADDKGDGSFGFNVSSIPSKTPIAAATGSSTGG